MGDALENFERLNDKAMARWARTFLEAQSGIDRIPKGFYTEGQLAEKFDYSASGMRAHLNQLKENGLVTEKRFKVWCGTRRYSVSHYKLKGQDK